MSKEIPEFFETHLERKTRIEQAMFNENFESICLENLHRLLARVSEEAKDIGYVLTYKLEKSDLN